MSRDGAIDWLCWPRFDSGACFAALLGDRSNGCWKVAPVGQITRVGRRYLPDTLILETTFETDAGVVTLTDFMPQRGPDSHVVRLVESRGGEVAMRMELTLRFDYGAVIPWVTQEEVGMLRAVAGPDLVVLRTPVTLRDEDMTTVAEFMVRPAARAAAHRMGAGPQ